MMKMTGTTICGLLYEDGVILGADTRATMKDASGSSILIDHNCSKINRLSEKIYCCGAGSAADMKRLSGLVEANLECQFPKAHTDIPVICPVTMIKQTLYKYHGYLMCAFIIGGIDSAGGNQLFSIFQHGSSHGHKFCAMGTGLQPAMGILEAGWKENLSEKEGLTLMVDAIKAGILYDLGSGSKVDVTIIRKNGQVSSYKPYKVLSDRMPKCVQCIIPLGTTKVLSTQVIPIEKKPSEGKKRKLGIDDSGDGPRSKMLKSIQS